MNKGISTGMLTHEEIVQTLKDVQGDLYKTLSPKLKSEFLLAIDEDSCNYEAIAKAQNAKTARKIVENIHKHATLHGIDQYIEIPMDYWQQLRKDVGLP